MFIGYAAAPGNGLGARLGAYRTPNGTWRNHRAGRLIHRHRAEIEMHITVMDLPGPRIQYLAEQMISERQPKWNVLEQHRRR